jgi:hypothetical protein
MCTIHGKFKLTPLNTSSALRLTMSLPAVSMPSSPPPLERKVRTMGARLLVADAGAGCGGCGVVQGDGPVVGETMVAERRGPREEGD